MTGFALLRLDDCGMQFILPHRSLRDSDRILLPADVNEWISSLTAGRNSREGYGLAMSDECRQRKTWEIVER